MWFYHVLPSNIQVLSDEQSNMGLFFGRTPRDGNLFTGKMMSHQFLCYHIGENGKPKWDVKLRIHVLASIAEYCTAKSPYALDVFRLKPQL